MNSKVKSERNAAKRAAKLRRLLAVAAGSTMGLAYCLAAQQDEKNGFPLTAAMEWRKAAELFAPVSLLSDRCWHQWERLMQLPRCFAKPITDCNESALPFSPLSKQFAILGQPINILSLPATAGVRPGLHALPPEQPRVRCTANSCGSLNQVVSVGQAFGKHRSNGKRVTLGFTEVVS